MTLDLSGYVDDILESRRAGIVNDRTFFEVGLSARGDFGQQAQLQLGKPRAPLSKAQLAGNFYQYDVDNAFTTSISRDQRITMKLNFRFLRSVANVKFQIQTVIMCDGGYFETINSDVPGLPENCVAASTDQMKMTFLGRDDATQLNKALFETSVNSNGKIGCAGYVLLAFDAGTKFTHINKPIKHMVATDKRFAPCMNNNKGECRGIYQRLDLHETLQQPDVAVGESSQVDVSGVFLFRGTETHIPVGLMQYHCDFGVACQVEPSTVEAIIPTTTSPITEMNTTTVIIETTTDTLIETADTTQSSFMLSFNLTDLMDHMVILDQNQQRLKASDLVSYGCSSLALSLQPGVANPRAGAPIDKLDGALRKWHNCRKCAVIDASDKGRECGTHYQFDMFYRRCGNMLPSCARSICECDLQLTMDLASSSFEAQHAHGAFIKEGKCVTKSPGQWLACCPLRHGLFTLYNLRTTSCCGDGYVVPIGSC